MPKKKIVQLRQSPREKSYIFDLQDDEVAMVTGAMGGCVSVIILWGISGGRFSHVRGHHGSGGIDAVDWDSLKAGVPKNDPTVLVVVAYAPGETSYGIEKIRGEVSKKTAGTRRVFAGALELLCGSVRTHSNYSAI